MIRRLFKKKNYNYLVYKNLLDQNHHVEMKNL